MSTYDPAKVGYQAGNSPYRRGMQTARGSLDFDEFTDIMNDLLKRAWGDGWGWFSQNEPTGNDPEKVEIPAITFDTVRRIPSETHKSPEPILYDKIRDPEHPTTFLELYRQWFDMEVSFFVYHQTNREARLLMEAFENFLFEYKEYFKNCGISDIIFKSEETPKVVTRWGKELPQRTLVYLVRIERISMIRSNTTQSINPVVVGQNDQYLANKDKDSTFMRHYGEQLRYEE